MAGIMPQIAVRRRYYLSNLCIAFFWYTTHNTALIQGTYVGNVFDYPHRVHQLWKGEPFVYAVDE